MSVTVDDRPLPTDDLGLRTVGQVLTHVQRTDRLVVSVLIDGEEPDLNQIGRLRGLPVEGHTVFIETTEPRELALEVIGHIEQQLQAADRFKDEAVSLLQASQTTKAMEKLNACFSAWQSAQDAVKKIGTLLRLDFDSIPAADDGRAFSTVLHDFGEQLRRIRTALEDHDYVALTDTLAYEARDMSAQWRWALNAIRQTLG